MYFKQLELVGFKSFANKTKLKFEPGLTAIVGPNGCGKSNICDAIRWVLGEQAPKSLRSSSMEDVIFNGTASAEPINVAEVSLTFSNENRVLPIDYNEVTITRRLYRSGESEYILNKTNVRLKDISTLLMGTGIGTSCYSIIEQGKIDLILSSKPEERRYIFEEASGITKYKSQKREALKKLEHTENNLVRINDIIQEVRRQINSIERHAKKAERYKTHFEEMKDLDLKFTAHELKKISADLEENKNHLGTLCVEEGKLKNELDEISTLIDRYREELDNIIMDLTATQEKRSDTAIFIDKCIHKVELNKERVNDLKNLKIKNEEALAGLKEKIRLEEDEISKIKEGFNDILKEKEHKERALAEKENSIQKVSHEIETLQREIKKSKNNTLDLLAFQTKAKNELIKLGADLQNRKSRVRRLEAEREKIKKERQNIESLLKLANNELDTCRIKVEKRKTFLDKLKNNLKSCEHTLEDIKARIIEDINIANSLNSKAEILKEMIKNLEGFDRGVRIILEGAKNGALRGVIGTVADMIEPREGYGSALEVVLNKKAQAVVVEDREAVEEALEFLRNKGTAHFIIYDEIRYSGRYNRNRVAMQRNGIQALFSFVKIDPSYQTLAEYLFDDIYIVENKKIADEALRRFRANVKFVTKDGFFIEKGHVFGGSVMDESTTTSIIGRTKRLEQITNQEARLRGDIEKLRAKEDAEKKTLDNIKKEIAQAENALKKEEIEFANILSKKEAIEGNLKKVNDEESVVSLEIEEVGELIGHISIKGDELNKNLNEKETEYARVQEFISSSQGTLQNKTKERNKMIFEVSELKSEIAFLKNTESQEARNLDKELKSYEELRTLHENRERDTRECKEKIAALETETENLTHQIEIKKREESRFAERLKEISESKKELSKNLHNREASLRQNQTVAQNLRNHIRNLEIKNRESELKITNIKDRIREAYKIDIQNAGIEIQENMNWEEAKNRIEVLKIKLEKLGPVNLVAIDEHKELEERLSFLTQQQEDLLSAKDSLHKAIVKINKTTKQLFIEAFGKIQVEFKNYFRMLFGGGHAELLLLDESDILESGIEIVVRPPGKKLQNLLLLSGGEKALIAIALLFSIFKVKPSPFCILDEVDAPLDESNIGRFARILQEFLKTSQFIVITHNKRTMQMADILYGITMQNKGISKVVSVKFAEDKKEPTSREEEEVLV